MLANAPTYATLPASNLERARRFYEDTLGFRPADVLPAGVMYETAAGSRFFVFPSSGAAAGTHTQLGFRVEDIETEVADLTARGVTFETYEMPGFDTATRIATLPANRAAWFKDSEGNLVGIIQMTG